MSERIGKDKGGLERLSIRDFRCLESVDIEPSPAANLIVGENASGKTSLLEAIFFVGRGRSFRAGNARKLVRDGCERFMVTGTVMSGGRSVRIGIQVGAGGVDMRLDGQAAQSISELAELIPVQVIDPDIHKLVEDGPDRRRSYVDWGTFHVKPSFLEDWRRYRRALRQRNASLRQGMSPDSVAAWNGELEAAGTAVADARAEYVAGLKPLVAETCGELIGHPVEIEHLPGWDRSEALGDVFARSSRKDLASALAVAGPHRADLRIRAEARVARRRVSRGQQKLIAAGLILAQLKALPVNLGHRGVLLIDDPVAELDANALPRFMEAVFEQPAQLFVTVLDKAAIGAARFDMTFDTSDFSSGRVSRETSTTDD